jgi:hypothetical protein
MGHIGSEELTQCLDIDLSRTVRILEQCLDLRCKQDAIAQIDIIQWFDPEMIPSQKHLAQA